MSPKHFACFLGCIRSLSIVLVITCISQVLCLGSRRERWIAARRRELLPTPYVHVVFTLPPQLAALALQNRKLIYGLLLRASAETLLEVAHNPAHLGAEIGFFSVLHTWKQKLQLHPHVCVSGLSLSRH